MMVGIVWWALLLSTRPFVSASVSKQEVQPKFRDEEKLAKHAYPKELASELLSGQAHHDRRATPTGSSRDRALQDSKPLLADYFGGQPGFYHGVASGDPLADAFVVWTRYTPVSAYDVETLEVRVAKIDRNIPVSSLLDPSKNPKLIRGLANAEPASDWVVKIDVRGLESRTDYVYTFIHHGTQKVSDIGLTHTAPKPNEYVASMRYAVFSCSNFYRGYFHAYDLGSTIENLDLWFHVGDYFYDKSVKSRQQSLVALLRAHTIDVSNCLSLSQYGYGTQTGPRFDPVLPNKEIVSLQDYRLRYASYTHADEALRLLRRKVPLMGSWDDHEMSNNDWYGGAQAHDPVADGDWTVRVNHAYQAYMEWMPLRHRSGSKMGMVRLGDMTQILEWGQLATFITFDTRVTARSKDPTVYETVPFDNMQKVVADFPDVRDYSDTKSAAYAAIRASATESKALCEDPSFEIVGASNLRLLNDTFTASKLAGKPWQIWAANVMMGSQIPPDPNLITESFSTAAKRKLGLAYLSLIYRTPPGIQLRALKAMADFQVTFNRDSFDGFAYERNKMLQIAENSANNMIVLGGDVHDAYAWVLFQNGILGAKPVAINLVCPGVTSSGTGPTIFSAFPGPIQDLFGISEIIQASHAGYKAQLPGMRHVNFFDRGFFAVHATPSKHIAEFFDFNDTTIALDYATARQQSGRLTAVYKCSVSLETRAGEKGSLDARPECNAITFENQRPSIYNIPVPIANVPSVDSLSDCGYTGCQFVI